jgi:hypothetical protein
VSKERWDEEGVIPSEAIGRVEESMGFLSWVGGRIEHPATSIGWVGIQNSN